MDITTIVLQAINFLIFAAILHRLLYRPVRDAMNERRDEMERQRDEARRDRQEAESIRERAEEREEKLEEKKEAILREAREKAESERQKILEEAEAEARKLFDRYRKSQEKELRQFLEEGAGAFGNAAVAIAGRILQDAGTSLADRSVDRIGEELEGLGDDDKDDALSALREGGGEIVIFAASEPDDERKRALRKRLDATFDKGEIPVRFETDPDLLAGFDAEIGSLRVRGSWGEPLREAIEEESRSMLDALRERRQSSGTPPDRGSASGPEDGEEDSGGAGEGSSHDEDS